MQPTLNEASNYLQNLNLEYLADAMCSDAYPLPRWDKKNALKCMQIYKNFLFLFKKYPNISLVPTKEIDEFWHNHILYTKNYYYDCMQIFGYYLHHTPANPNENQQELISDYLQTKKLYIETFSEPMEFTLSL